MSEHLNWKLVLSQASRTIRPPCCGTVVTIRELSAEHYSSNSVILEIRQRRQKIREFELELLYTPRLNAGRSRSTAPLRTKLIVMVVRVATVRRDFSHNYKNYFI